MTAEDLQQMAMGAINQADEAIQRAEMDPEELAGFLLEKAHELTCLALGASVREAAVLLASTRGVQVMRDEVMDLAKADPLIEEMARERQITCPRDDSPCVSSCAVRRECELLA